MPTAIEMCKAGLAEGICVVASGAAKRPASRDGSSTEVGAISVPSTSELLSAVLHAARSSGMGTVARLVGSPLVRLVLAAAGPTAVGRMRRFTFPTRSCTLIFGAARSSSGKLSSPIGPAGALSGSAFTSSGEPSAAARASCGRPGALSTRPLAARAMAVSHASHSLPNLAAAAGSAPSGTSGRRMAPGLPSPSPSSTLPTARRQN
eukprot:scaffold86281_cov27-Tisochrysis_lutea.AAC.1